MHRAAAPSYRLVLSLTLGMGVLLVSCGDPSVGGSNEGWRADSVAQLDLQLHRLIGSPEVEFGDLRALVADNEGRTYAIDGQARQIVVIEEDGSTRTIGQPGDGPGEFGHVSSMAWVGDRLIVMDVRLQRFNVFERTGEFVSARRLDHQFMQLGSPSMYSGGRRAYTRIGGSDSEEYLIFDEAGGVTSIPVLPEPEKTPGGMMCATADRRQYPGFDLPFSDRGPLRAFLPDGELALAHEDSFLIQIHDLRSGELRREITLDYPPRPLTDAEWEMRPEVQHFRDLERQHGALQHRDHDGDCPFEALRPETWPVIRTILSDESGRIWVEATTRSKDGYELVLFDADGSLMARGIMPERDAGVTPYIRGGRMHTVVADELGVQSIAVFAIDIRR